MTDKIRCEGQRRFGGAFTLGKPKWVQCKNDAIIKITVHQEKTETLPSCLVCWKEAVDKGMEIIRVDPI